MKTLVIIEVTHSKPIPNLTDLVASRAWSIDGVSCAEVPQEGSPTGRISTSSFDLGFAQKFGARSLDKIKCLPLEMDYRHVEERIARSLIGFHGMDLSTQPDITWPEIPTKLTPLAEALALSRSQSK